MEAQVSAAEREAVLWYQETESTLFPLVTCCGGLTSGERSLKACSHCSKEISGTGSLCPHLILRNSLFISERSQGKVKCYPRTGFLWSCGDKQDRRHIPQVWLTNIPSFKHLWSSQGTVELSFWRSLPGCLIKDMILCFLSLHVGKRPHSPSAQLSCFVLISLHELSWHILALPLLPLVEDKFLLCPLFCSPDLSPSPCRGFRF